MQIFIEAILLFCTVKLLLWDTILTGIRASGRIFICDQCLSLGFNPAESNEVVVLFVISDEVVNARSTIELSCVVHGRTSAPSIEWVSVANGRTTVRNSTSNRVIVPPDHVIGYLYNRTVSTN